MSAKADGRMKRWQEQRWILDAVIRTVGIEWDQGRVGYGSAPGGPQSVADAPSVTLGDNPRDYLCDWLDARLKDKPVKSMKTFVDSTGRRMEESI